FQITNTTWKQFGRSVSGAEKYATAISAPFKIKEAKQRGLGPWAAYDVPLGHAAKDYYAHHLSDTHYNVRPPDSAKTHPASTATTAGGSGSPNVQQPAPVHIVIHGNTGAVSPISANAAAGGVY
ncbi:MAG: hypothetical protein ACREE9_02375, partial [Stellaceae bacterium]